MKPIYTAPFPSTSQAQSTERTYKQMHAILDTQRHHTDAQNIR